MKRPCWVSATVDGQKAIERLLQPGEQQTVDGPPRAGADRRRRGGGRAEFNGAEARAARQVRRGRHRPLQPDQLQRLSAGALMGPTPLLDFFKRGEVARDVRLLAAQGALAPRAHEQLAILVLLLEDPDPRNPRDRRRDAEPDSGRGARDVSRAVRCAGRPARVLRRPRHLSRRRSRRSRSIRRSADRRSGGGGDEPTRTSA